jgi:hypothetical protein
MVRPSNNDAKPFVLGCATAGVIPAAMTSKKQQMENAMSLSIGEDTHVVVRKNISALSLGWARTSGRSMYEQCARKRRF